MSWAIVIVGCVALVFGLFWFLQWLSDRTYKPSPAEIRKILGASMEGRLNLGLFDEFSCVRIAYDKSLDDIREKYNRIVNNPEYMEGEITQENATPLNNEGKARLKELIYELERIST